MLYLAHLARIWSLIRFWHSDSTFNVPSSSNTLNCHPCRAGSVLNIKGGRERTSLPKVTILFRAKPRFEPGPRSVSQPLHHTSGLDRQAGPSQAILSSYPAVRSSPPPRDLSVKPPMRKGRPNHSRELAVFSCPAWTDLPQGFGLVGVQGVQLTPFVLLAFGNCIYHFIQFGPFGERGGGNIA